MVYLVIKSKRKSAAKTKLHVLVFYITLYITLKYQLYTDPGGVRGLMKSFENLQCCRWKFQSKVVTNQTKPILQPKARLAQNVQYMMYVTTGFGISCDAYTD